MATLTAFDIVVLLMIVLGALAGVMRGFVTEVLSLLAWVAGIFAVRFGFVGLKAFLLRFMENDAGAAILAFVLLFLGAYIAFRYIAQSLGSRTRSSIVGPVDRLLGLGFGAFKGLLGAAVLFLLLKFAVEVVDPGKPYPAWLQAGRTEPLLEMVSKAMVDFVEDVRRPASKAKPGDPGYDPDDRDALDKLLDKAAGAAREL